MRLIHIRLRDIAAVIAMMPAMITGSPGQIVAVALNPAVDRVLEVPGLRPGAHQVARLLARYQGGKAVNVAKGLAGLGVPCTLTGLLGRDEYEYYTQDLQRFNVRMAMVRVAGQTRENITLVDPTAHNETHLRDRGFVVSAEELTGLRSTLTDLAQPGTVFVYSGSLPLGIGPEELTDLLRICRQAGADLAIDTSGPALAAAVSASAWLIKPNREELEELLQLRLPTAEALLAAGRDLARRIPLVLVSDGANGAYLFTGQDAWHARCPVTPSHVASTVGCGDALLAGFLAGLHKSLDYAAALKLAVAAAAGTALSLTTLFQREQVSALLNHAQVEKIQ
jgi:1-phosphofructokinase